MIKTYFIFQKGNYDFCFNIFQRKLWSVSFIYFSFSFCDLIQRALSFCHQVTFHYFDNRVAGKKFENDFADKLSFSLVDLKTLVHCVFS